MSSPEPAEVSRPTRKPSIGRTIPTTEPDKWAARSAKAAMIVALMKTMQQELNTTPMVIRRLDPFVHLRRAALDWLDTQPRLMAIDKAAREEE